MSLNVCFARGYTCISHACFHVCARVCTCVRVCLHSCLCTCARVYSYLRSTSRAHASSLIVQSEFRMLNSNKHKHKNIRTGFHARSEVGTGKHRRNGHATQRKLAITKHNAIMLHSRRDMLSKRLKPKRNANLSASQKLKTQAREKDLGQYSLTADAGGHHAGIWCFYTLSPIARNITKGRG